MWATFFNSRPRTEVTLNEDASVKGRDLIDNTRIALQGTDEGNNTISFKTDSFGWCREFYMQGK